MSNSIQDFKDLTGPELKLFLSRSNKIVKNYTPEDIEALTNWDGLLCKPPFSNAAAKRQYYSRFLERMLWQYFTEEDWQQIATVVDELRVSPKIKRATKFLLARHGA